MSQSVAATYRSLAELYIESFHVVVTIEIVYCADGDVNVSECRRHLRCCVGVHRLDCSNNLQSVMRRGTQLNHSRHFAPMNY